MDDLLKLEPVVVFLLPGFLATWVFYTLTAHRRKKPFERIVEAVICTAAVQAILPVVRRVCIVIGDLLVAIRCECFRCRWLDEYQPLRSAAIGIILGIVVAAIANNDMFHGFLRNRKWYLIRGYKKMRNDGGSGRGRPRTRRNGTVLSND